MKDDLMGYPGSAPTTEPVIQLDQGRPVFSSRPADFVAPQHHDLGVNEKPGIRCTSYFEYSSNHRDTAFVGNRLGETFTFWQKRSIAVASWLLLMPLAICGYKILRLYSGNRGRGFETSALQPTGRAD
jgi:hypothetical protein